MDKKLEKMKRPMRDGYPQRLRRRISAMRSGLFLKQRTAVALQPNDLIAIIPVRNERARVPYLLEYYRTRGVDKFFIIDNDSSDGTGEYLSGQPDVALFFTRERYSRAERARNWIDLLLRRYARGHWTVIADADEFLIYPRWEEISIKDLCGYLEREGADALTAPLLDLYADGFPVLPEAGGREYWEVFPYFDRDTDLTRARKGGVRRRVFGVDAYLKKTPLVKYDSPMRILSSHRMEGIHPSALQGALLHFKFDAAFFLKAQREAHRQQYWFGAFEYKQYLRVIAENPNLTLRSDVSIAFSGSRQLVEIGMMRPDPRFEQFVAETARTDAGQRCA